MKVAVDVDEKESIKQRGAINGETVTISTGASSVRELVILASLAVTVKDDSHYCNYNKG